VEVHSLFALKYSSSEKGAHDFIRNPALPFEQTVFFFMVHTLISFLQVCHRKLKRNYPGNVCFKQGDNLLTREKFGKSGYISDGNRNAEVPLTIADNAERLGKSIKCSRADSHVKM